MAKRLLKSFSERLEFRVGGVRKILKLLHSDKIPKMLFEIKRESCFLNSGAGS